MAAGCRNVTIQVTLLPGRGDRYFVKQISFASSWKGIQLNSYVATFERALALNAAQTVVQQLLRNGFVEAPATQVQDQPVAVATANPTAATTGPVPLPALFEQLIQSGETLAQRIPAPQPMPIGRGAARAWRDAVHPATILQGYHRLSLRTQRLAQRQARQQWLAEQLTIWEGRWQPYVTAVLDLRTADAALPLDQSQAAAYATVDRLRRQVLQRLAEIDRWLEAAAEETRAAEATVEELCTALTTYCATLPDRSLYGLLQAAGRPQQWLRWLWQLNVTLPRRLRRLAHALAAREVATYHEANGHVVRQLGLAILQDVQSQWSTMAKAQKGLVAASDYLATTKAALVAALPWPWDAKRLTALGQLWARHAGFTVELPPLALDTLLTYEATGSWSAADHDTAAQGEEIGEALIRWLMPRYGIPAAWTSSDWLQATFASSAGGQRSAATPDDAGLARFTTWLAHLRTQATPTWPADAAEITPRETWLLLPRFTAGDTMTDDTGEDDAGAVAAITDDAVKERTTLVQQQWLHTQQQDVTVVEAAVTGFWVVVRCTVA